MKKFKLADFWISCVLISGFTIATLVRQDGIFFTGYFTVGGWQVISMLTHTHYHWFTKKGGKRYVYHWITFFSVVGMPMGTFWILWFMAPFMALYYTWLCFEETFLKMKRPLASLK